MKASAAGIVGPTGFQNPEEKLRGRRKAVEVSKERRKAGSPSVVQLAYLSDNIAATAAEAGEAAERDAFCRSPF